MTYAVIGSRSFSDDILMGNWLSRFLLDGDTIVSGGARGADTLAAEWAREYGVNVKEYEPDWSQGRGAALKRNETIIAESDMVIAFWDGTSTGTRHAIGVAKRLKKPTLVVYV